MTDAINTKLAHLRTLLHDPPSTTSWKSLCDILHTWPQDDSFFIAIDYAKQGILRWEQQRPDASWVWWQSLAQRWLKPDDPWAVCRHALSVWQPDSRAAIDSKQIEAASVRIGRPLPQLLTDGLEHTRGLTIFQPEHLNLHSDWLILHAEENDNNPIATYIWCIPLETLHAPEPMVELRSCFRGRLHGSSVSYRGTLPQCVLQMALFHTVLHHPRRYDNHLQADPNGHLGFANLPTHYMPDPTEFPLWDWPPMAARLVLGEDTLALMLLDPDDSEHRFIAAASRYDGVDPLKG